MTYKTVIKIAVVGIIGLQIVTAIAQGQDEDEEKKFAGNIRMRYDYVFVNGDTGRFREDNWQNDDASYGVDWLELRSTAPSENGYEWELKGKALYNYDYDLSFLLEKESSHYFKMDFSGLRKYYDGSNEYWDPALYSASSRLAEMPDGDSFLDRRNYNLEFGIVPDEGPQFIAGWHRLVTDGRRVRLFGGRATDGTLPDFYGIPGVVNQRGITDTVYGEIAHTFAEKYNVRIKQEFEQYHDDQLTVFPRSDSGTLTDQRFHDDPGYTNWRTMFMLDSFLDEKTYVTTNYMYNYINNDSSRDASDMELGFSMDPYTNSEVGNSQKTNVASLGTHKRDILPNFLPNLDLTTGLSYEDSRTRSSGIGLLGGNGESFNSSRRDKRLEQRVRLVYKGLKRTTLSFNADIESNDLTWKENESGEVWNTDVDYTDQVYAVKAVHRFSKDLKSTLQFSSKNLERSYTNQVDTTTGYPGFLGSYRIKGNDVMAKTDWKISNTTSTSLMYQFIQESIDTDAGNKTQNLEINRGSGSLSMNPSPNLFFVSTFMLENYQLDTPANGTATNTFAPGPSAFDYIGNSFSIMLDGTYVFTPKTSCTFGFQHTEALGEGDGDNTNDSAYDKAKLMLNHKISETQTLSAGYQFVNFDNHNGGNFDDYDAHGLLFFYEFIF